MAPPVIMLPMLEQFVALQNTVLVGIDTRSLTQTGWVNLLSAPVSVVEKR